MSDIYTPTTSGERLPGAQTTAVAAEPISATPPFQPAEIAKQYEAVGAAKQAELKTKQELTEAGRAQARGIEQEYKPQLAEAAKAPEFKPSQATAGELAALFGMIGAMGALGGKGSYASALGAMNAMGGMLKGYNQGRKDLFDQEKAIYDKKIQENKLHFDRINQAYERALKAAPNNLSAAQSQLERELTGLGANVLAQQSKLEGMSKSYEMWRLARNNYDNKLSSSAPVSIVGPDGKPQLITRQELQRRLAAGETVTPVPKAGAAQTEERGQRMINALSGVTSAVTSINRLASGATTGMLPFLSSKEGMVNYLSSTAGRAFSPTEDKFMNTYLAGIGRNLATLEASGLATGLVGLSNSLQSGVYINSGEGKWSTANKLADIRRIAESAISPVIQSGRISPEQRETAKSILEQLKKAVPFTTDDVADAYYASQAAQRQRKGKPPLPRIGEQSQQLVPGETSISAPSATSTLPAGIPAGSVLIGTTADGKTPVYQAPDGKKYTPEGQ